LCHAKVEETKALVSPPGENVGGDVSPRPRGFCAHGQRVGFGVLIKGTVSYRKYRHRFDSLVKTDQKRKQLLVFTNTQLGVQALKREYGKQAEKLIACVLEQGT